MTETLSPAAYRRELVQRVPETAVVAAGLRTFALRGWHVWRNNVGAMAIGGGGGRKPRFVKFGEEGLPDITGFTPWGAHVAAEAKRPSGDRRLDPPQSDHLAAVRKAGGVAIVFSTAQELQDAIERAELRHWAARVSIVGDEGSKKMDRLRWLDHHVAIVEARFALRPGDREAWAREKMKRRVRSRAKKIAARMACS